MTKTLRQLNISTWDSHSGESHDSRVRNAISHLSYIFSTVQAQQWLSLGDTNKTRSSAKSREKIRVCDPTEVVDIEKLQICMLNNFLV